jgi:flagellar protein FliO/FliZ
MRALAVDETRSLGNRQYLVVASYEGKKFLLGVCPGRIEMLSALDGSGVKEKSRE